MYPRPTLRCLREDYKIEIPDPNVTMLHEYDYEIMRGARDTLYKDPTKIEKIKSIKDNVFFKLKTARYRGILFFDHKPPEVKMPEAWVLASGIRRAGDTDDFYKKIETTSKNNLKLNRKKDSNHKKGKTTDSDYLLPTSGDYKRFSIELLLFSRDQLIISIQDEIRQAARNPGQLHVCDLPDMHLELLVTEESTSELQIGFRPNENKLKFLQRLVFQASIRFLDPEELEGIDHIAGGTLSSANGDYCYMGFLKTTLSEELDAG